MTQFNGNRRGDVMRLAQFASVVDPGALRVPIIRGRATFKLAPLAAANGFVGHAAHDALGDVRATVHLLRVIRSQAPNASALFPALVSKTGVVDALLDAEFAVLVSHFGVAVAKPVLPICPNPAYPAQWLAIDLTDDPAPLLRLDPPALAAALAAPRSVLCRIKTNGMPLVISATHPAVQRVVPANVLPDAPARAHLLRANADFAHRLGEAACLMGPVYPPAEYIEERLYEGGFFPTAADEARFAAFHAAAPSEKFVIAQLFDDERARYLAGRVIYNEWPQELPADHYAHINRERHARYRQADVPWTTIDTALGEIAKLRNVPDAAAAVILDEYESYLRSLNAANAA